MQKICIVIPCYNEEKRFPVQEFNTYFEQNPDYYFCLVNDGSSDKTSLLLNNIHQSRENRIIVVDLNTNVGKAEAVRIGVLRALEWDTFDYIGYFDADFSTPLSEIKSFLNYSGDYLLIVGSRIKRLGSVIERSYVRHYFGRIFATAASLILKLPVYDTQCGAKLIHSSIAPQVFKDKFISRWIFDIEIFARLITVFGIEKVKKLVFEVPLTTWIEKGDSRIKPGYFFKIPFELYKIYSHYKIKNRTYQKSIS